MRLVLDTDSDILTVRRYAPGEIDVGGTLLRAPFIVSPSRLVSDWPVASIAALDELWVRPAAPTTYWRRSGAKSSLD